MEITLVIFFVTITLESKNFLLELSKNNNENPTFNTYENRKFY